MPAATTSAVEILQRIAGPTASFRPGQLEAISALVDERKRALVVQRTGWGKSAVYFVATRLMRDRGAGLTLLVSPLLALMRNQIEMATRAGVKAVTINSSNRDEWQATMAEIDDDRIDLLLVSPERFHNPQFRDDVFPVLARRTGLLVIDEVHCISDWGHDFRPDYRRLAQVIDLLPDAVPVLGTTATANDRVVADVIDQLGHDLLVVRGPLGREGLRLSVLDLPMQPQRLAWLAQNLPLLRGSGIVYCLTIDDCTRVSAWLAGQGIEAPAYSGQTDTALREVLEQRLLANEVKALVATSALGMGFDKPDLAFVVHYQSPGSPIAYYQQVGRAGRALDNSHGILLTGREDREIQDYFITTAFPAQDHAERVVELLASAPGPVTTNGLESEVNIRHTRLEGMLKVLEVEGAVARSGRGWVRTAAPWTYDADRVERVTAVRRREQEAMRAYATTDACLMAFLRHELDDNDVVPCGCCSRCEPPGPSPAVDPDLARSAHEQLRSRPLRIEPRKMWASGGRIPADQQIEEGRLLSVWNDGGWGGLVASGSEGNGGYPDELVEGLVGLITTWRPTPRPTWLTFVPSRRRPHLVEHLAGRLAKQLRLPMHATLVSAHDHAPQRDMENSIQQQANITGAFAVEGHVPPGPVLLVDDTVDSRWTLTVVGSALREAGAGPVFPVALARAISP